MINSDTPDPVPPEGWHLDKRVPLGIILTILLQTFALGAFITRLEGRVSNLEAADVRHETNLERDRIAIEAWGLNVNALTGRLIRVEEQTSTTKDVVKEINGKMDTLLLRKP